MLVNYTNICRQSYTGKRIRQFARAIIIGPPMVIVDITEINVPAQSD